MPMQSTPRIIRGLATRSGYAAEWRLSSTCRDDGIDRAYFCGAYWRNGFHEDGVVAPPHARSLQGARVCTAPSTRSLRHRRFAPRSMRCYRLFMMFVDSRLDRYFARGFGRRSDGRLHGATQDYSAIRMSSRSASRSRHRRDRARPRTIRCSRSSYFGVGFNR